MKEIQNLQKWVGKNIVFSSSIFTASGKIIYFDIRDNTFLVHVKNIISGLDRSWMKIETASDFIRNKIIKDYNDEDKFYFIDLTEIKKILKEDFKMDTE